MLPQSTAQEVPKDISHQIPHSGFCQLGGFLRRKGEEGGRGRCLQHWAPSSVLGAGTPLPLLTLHDHSRNKMPFQSLRVGKPLAIFAHFKPGLNDLLAFIPARPVREKELRANLLESWSYTFPPSGVRSPRSL